MAQGPPDPEAEADAQRLKQRLLGLGATEREVFEAEQAGALGPLALELALRGPGEPIPFAQAARQAGLQPEEAARLWRALGFPDPLDPPASVTRKQIEALRVLAHGSRALLGPDRGLDLARVLGSSVAQLAEAIVDAFRVEVEMPRRDRGDPASEVVADYARTAAVMVPALTDVIGVLLAGHLVSVSRASWALDEQRAAVTRDLVIGFADLVEYTRAARGLSPTELSAIIGRFESQVREIVSRHGGRVVKLIGDEAMFALVDRGRTAALALGLLGELAGEGRPEVRIGMAAGAVVSHHGDYYGDVVNLAARLVNAAGPGSALLSHHMLEDPAGVTGAEEVELPPLKGYDAPVHAWRLSLR
jgi:adenylate cyclase